MREFTYRSARATLHRTVSRVSLQLDDRTGFLRALYEARAAERMRTT